jgi:FAD binding domain
MTDVDVVIAGGGPTALMLACELRLAGVEPVVLERLPEISQIPKGNGLVGQIVPMLDYRGLLERFSAGSTAVGPVPRFAFGPLMLDFSRLGDSPLHILAIPQRRLEERLGERLAELGGTVRRGHELTAATQDEDVVTLDVRGPDGDYRLRTRYLVGCDGAHSPGAQAGRDRVPEGAEALRELFGDALDQPDPLRAIGDLLRQPEQLRRIGELMEGSDVRYPMPGAGDPPHPLLGKLAPDLQLETGDGVTRVAELLRTARSILLDLTDDAAVAGTVSDWTAAPLTVIAARCLTRPAPAVALFIRPDGYVAWAAASGAPDPAAGLDQALRSWLGAPPPPDGH